MDVRSIGNAFRQPDTGLCLLFGALLGLLAKYLDTVAVDGSWQTAALHHLADLFTRPGVWVLFAILIAANGKTMARSAICTFLFFAGMLVSYYAYSAWLFGFFPLKYFLFWGAAALLSPAAAAVVWLAKNNERLAWFLPALPAGLLLDMAIGFQIHGGFRIWLVYAEELVMYAAACAVFYRNPRQLAISALLSVPVAFLLDYFAPYHF
jgi:hypothetical protein